MAGEDQHYDPRFLLKGFFSKRSGKKVFTWYFEKNCAPTQENTKNIGNANLFYGSSGPDTLDEHITDKENGYAVIVDRVRDEKKIRPADTDTLAEFVYFQGMRTQAAREIYSSAFASVMRDIRQDLGTPEGMARFMQRVLQEEHKRIERGVAEGLKKYGSKLSYREMQVLIRRSGKEFVEKEASEYAFALDITLSAYLKEIRKHIKEFHNKALDDWVKTSSRETGSGLAYYRQLHWSIWTPQDGSLILGDAPVLYREADSTQLSSGIAGKANLILLPLSQNLLLIGAADETVSLPSRDEINRNSTELSLYFFVSHQCSEEEAEYHKLIGKRAPSVEQEDLLEVIKPL